MMAGKLDLVWCQDSQGVIGFILGGICICLPYRAKSVFKLCLIYETDLNRGWWEAVGA
jgi:hypothetical protein